MKKKNSLFYSARNFIRNDNIKFNNNNNDNNINIYSDNTNTNTVNTNYIDRHRNHLLFNENKEKEKEKESFEGKNNVSFITDLSKSDLEKDKEKSIINKRIGGSVIIRNRFKSFINNGEFKLKKNFDIMNTFNTSNAIRSKTITNPIFPLTNELTEYRHYFYYTFESIKMNSNIEKKEILKNMDVNILYKIALEEKLPFFKVKYIYIYIYI